MSRNAAEEGGFANEVARMMDKINTVIVGDGPDDVSVMEKITIVLLVMAVDVIIASVIYGVILSMAALTKMIN